jgi:predicted DCC family thiol-disulfide oxidoreductase YuxK
MASARLHVLYDGQCAFCTRALDGLRHFDSRKAFEFHDANDRDAIRRRFPSLAAGADLDQAMWVITEAGDAHRGFFAFRRMLRATPALWMLLPLLHFPGASWLGPHVYGWVAQNRRSLGCRSGVCEMPRPLGRSS